MYTFNTNWKILKLFVGLVSYFRAIISPYFLLVHLIIQNAGEGEEQNIKTIWERNKQMYLKFTKMENP